MVDVSVDDQLWLSRLVRGFAWGLVRKHPEQAHCPEAMGKQFAFQTGLDKARLFSAEGPPVCSADGGPHGHLSAD